MGVFFPTTRLIEIQNCWVSEGPKVPPNTMDHTVFFKLQYMYMNKLFYISGNTVFLYQSVSYHRQFNQDMTNNFYNILRLKKRKLFVANF